MFWNRNKDKTENTIDWQPLTSIEQIDELIKESQSQAVAIFKHSTRCGTSSTALNRLERKWNDDLNAVKMYFLDLISYRDVSNAVAEKTGIRHESPQLILFKNENVAYMATHFGIDVDELKQQL